MKFTVEVEKASVLRRGGPDQIFLKIAGKNNPYPLEGTSEDSLFFYFDATFGSAEEYLLNNFGIENVEVIDADRMKID